MFVCCSSTALLVGFVLTMANYSFFSSLLAFFITSSRLTRWGGAQKKKIDPDYREGQTRGEERGQGGGLCMCPVMGAVLSPVHTEHSRNRVFTYFNS